MRIEKLIFQDFKGRTGPVDLAKLNLVVGPNGSGKTALLLGPQYLARGTVPHGAKPEAVAAFAGPLGCKVTAQLDDGFEWVRGLHADGNGRMVTSVAVSSVIGQGVREAERQVCGHVGDYAPMFSLGALLALSPDKLREHILSLCVGAGGGTADPAELADQIGFQFLRAILGNDMVSAVAQEDVYTCGTHPKTRRKNIVELADKLPEETNSALLQQLIGLRGVMDTCGGDLNRCIAKALDTAKKTRDDAKRDEATARATAGRLADEKAAQQVPTGTLDELKEKRTDLDFSRITVAEQIGNQEGRTTSRKTYVDELETARSDVATARMQLEELSKANIDVDVAMADRLVGEAKALDCQTELPDPEPARTAWFDAQTATEKATQETARRRHTYEDWDAAEERLKREIAAAEKSPWAGASKLLDMVGAGLTQATMTCNGCGHIQSAFDIGAIEGWRAVRELVTLNVREDKLVDLRTALASTIETVASAAAALKAATQALVERIDDEETAKAKHDAAVERYNVAHSAAETSKAKADGLRAEALNLRKGAEEHNGNLDRLRKSIADFETLAVDRESQVNAIDAEGGLVNVDDLDRQRAALAVAIATLDDQIDCKTRAASLETELARALRDAETWKVAKEVAKGIAKAIGVLRDEVMRDLVAPLVDGINEFLAIAAPGTRAYCKLQAPRSDRHIFELGWEVDGRRIALEALSGGESALFCVGLAAALVRLADPPLKLLLIEAGPLDPENLGLVLAAIEAIAEPMGLGNAIVASHIEPAGGTWSETWNIVELQEA